MKMNTLNLFTRLFLFNILSLVLPAAIVVWLVLSSPSLSGVDAQRIFNYSILLLAAGIGVNFYLMSKMSLSLKAKVKGLTDNLKLSQAHYSTLSGVSQSLSNAALEQSSAIEEISASVEEISSMAQQSSENAGKAQSLTMSAKDSADVGKAQMHEMNEAMKEIKESSNGVANIMKTINDIAFQTNLLALNAAVEAARAGEAGAGFSVVAEEVRRLALRCAEAAKETNSNIQSSIEKSERGTVINLEVSNSLNEIFEKIHHIDELVGEISGAMSEQESGMMQISEAVNEIDSVTHSNAREMEELKNGSSSLGSSIKSLKSDSFGISDLILGNKNKERVTKPKRKNRAAVKKSTTVKKKKTKGLKSGKDAGALVFPEEFDNKLDLPKSDSSDIDAAFKDFMKGGGSDSKNDIPNSDRSRVAMDKNNDQSVKSEDFVDFN